MDKAVLRKKYRDKRAGLAPEEVENLSLQIANLSLKAPIWDKTNYHLFLPIEGKKEVDTTFLMHILQGKDKTIVVSKSNFKDISMAHFILQENTRFKVSAYGIPEPVAGIQVPEKSIEVVFLPLLAYDLQGNRIGYGKGFYDRFLSKCAKNTLFVGLSFFEPETLITTHSNDVKMHYVITPSKIYNYID